jgi:LssY C-terminus
MNTNACLPKLLAAAIVAANLVLSSSAASQGELLGQGKQVDPPNDRLYVQEEGVLRVTAAVPSADETRRIFGTDLYRRNIQPVWLQVENRSDSPLYLTPMGLDKAYYTPRESALLSLIEESGSPKTGLFESKGAKSLRLAPRTIQSAYIFSRVDEGTKSFNVDVLGGDLSYNMSFFVPVPGLKLDHYEVDMTALYPEEVVEQVSLDELSQRLQAMPCCVSNSNGTDHGDPLNLAFIGSIGDLHYAFMRSGWDETETIYTRSLAKTFSSAITGGSYRYSPVSALYVFGRAQDTALQRVRGSIHQRNHLRIWLTPLRYEGQPVWIGQISRDIGVKFNKRTITTHKIDPDVDETREFLLEDLFYSQSLKQFAYVGGVGAAPYDQPRKNLGGDAYFTDGRRVVMWISGEPVGLDEVTEVSLD